MGIGANPQSTILYIFLEIKLLRNKSIIIFYLKNKNFYF